MTDWITIAKFGKTHGIQGWLRVYAYTENPVSIFEYQPWHLDSQNSLAALHIEDHKVLPDFQLVKLSGYDNCEQAQRLVNQPIKVPRDCLPELEDEYYWDQLIGLTAVTTQGLTLGRVIKILETKAHDIFVIQGDQQHLIPYVDAIVKSIDLAQQTILLDWQPEEPE